MKLIYVMDPYCGWCYAMSEQINIMATHFADQLPLHVLPAGMWAGHNTQRQSRQLISQIKSYDIKIAERSGVKFSAAYNQYLQDPSRILDSEIPSRAIVTTANNWPEQTLAFMHEIQYARYILGKDLNDTITYQDIALSLNISPEVFTEQFNSAATKAKTKETFALADKYAHNYPTLLLLRNGKTTIIDQGYTQASLLIKTIEHKLHAAYNIHLN
ncbi:DsbA family protein [Chitinophaga sp. Hz27]|uniref:DsbA family protein n=1 Tax=Chitinophaga sp. Hz27 TaxID=3347169 RepID=UPI0035D73F80